MVNRDFYGWKYGAVLKEVGYAYMSGTLKAKCFVPVSENMGKLLRSVFDLESSCNRVISSDNI